MHSKEANEEDEEVQADENHRDKERKGKCVADKYIQVLNVELFVLQPVSELCVSKDGDTFEKDCIRQTFLVGE